ncbi:MAG: quinone-dependent dihydroorotate dehydrogenase [Anaerolineae bacterium]|nr:quinone-dependent dihydroorotate dehydrogenase [Anaerolineae bacterium]
MSLYKSLVFPVLSRIDAETTHERTVAALARAQGSVFGRKLLRTLRGTVQPDPVQLFGLTFPNRIGVAAGFDKDARVASGLAALGFGHVEVGTLTPWFQQGNPRPRIFRLKEDAALINRMGFPNHGALAAVPRLQALNRKPRDFVLGVSLGKQKETALDDAVEDYVIVMRAVYDYADYLAVNVSSPNTPGLRELQGRAYLDAMLSRLSAEAGTLSGSVPRKPILLKIAPDLTWDELDEILAAALDHDIDGIIATNTTLSRSGLRDPNRDETGGMSGTPLRARSTAVIAHIHAQTGGKLPIIGVGGVVSADDVRAKLDVGAALVQIYTGLVYAGPGMAGRILRDLNTSSLPDDSHAVPI